MILSFQSFAIADLKAKSYKHRNSFVFISTIKFLDFYLNVFACFIRALRSLVIILCFIIDYYSLIIISGSDYFFSFFLFSIYLFFVEIVEHYYCKWLSQMELAKKMSFPSMAVTGDLHLLM